MNFRYKDEKVMRHKIRFRTGFTLLELLIVLAILGMLATLVGPAVMKQYSGSKTKTARLQIEELAAALDIYRLETNRYPNDDQGLDALVAPPSNQSNWNGPYLRKQIIPVDPWGNPYQYRFPGENAEFDLYSLGADGREGGTGEDGDVLSWL